jgi:glycosidase
MKQILILGLIFCSLLINAQSIKRVEPPFWWAGMKNTELQLMVYGEDLKGLSPEIDYQGIKIENVTSLDNPNYLFVDLSIGKNTRPGSFDLLLKSGKNTVAKSTYELKERKPNASQVNSFDASDVLYLITPDRFANGNPSNDSVEGMYEVADRYNKGGRHGGDIKGISDNLNYIRDLGFTAIWLNPVLENNMKAYSYHGYSTTDFYKVDPRFGTNQDYVELISKANEMGIKVIMDMIVNHGGLYHWWKDDLPANDWYNYQSEYIDNGIYQQTTHRKTVVQDPYASKNDIREFTDGWFVPTMPDLNQRNPYMVKYLIQNSIWWIEYSGVNGIRMDTYPYPDKDFMADWTCAVQNEYPDFNTVGEEWNLDPAIVSFWQQGKQNPNGYTSCLPSLMDFPLQSNLTKALNDKEDRFSGWVSVYEALGKDFMYADPMNLVVFPDNHDMSRFFTQVNEDYHLFKLGIAYTLTTRGIPQIYYGTEILMKNTGTTDHGVIRSDFPGGWANDPVNAFTGAGLSPRQKETLEMFRNILNWRKSNQTVQFGKLMHYNPKNGVYVIFRYDTTDKVMVVLSKNNQDVDLDLSRFNEMINGNETGTEIISGNSVTMNGTLTVPAMTPLIIDLN